MFLRTLFFIVVMYFLVKIISRLFLPSSDNRQSRSGPRFFWGNFQQFSQQKKNQNQQKKNKSQRFDEIEEAEFEEITEEENSTAKSSD